jgi:hypothetical protein
MRDRTDDVVRRGGAPSRHALLPAGHALMYDLAMIAVALGCFAVISAVYYVLDRI